MRKCPSLLLVIVLSGLTLLSAGCRGDEGPIMTSLVISIQDESQMPVSNVSVVLYNSPDDWSTETMPYRTSQITDQQGQVTYMEIDTAVYYIDASLDSINNWESGVVKKVLLGFANTTTIEIFESRSGNLSLAGGKSWILETYEINGADAMEFVEVCELDDILVFYKGPSSGRFQRLTGPEICTNETNLEGTWDILPNNTDMTIATNSSLDQWEIVELTTDWLKIEFTDAGNVVTAGYIPVN